MQVGDNNRRMIAIIMRERYKKTCQRVKQKPHNHAPIMLVNDHARIVGEWVAMSTRIKRSAGRKQS